MDTAEETESGLRSLGEMNANKMRKCDGRATTTMTTNDGDNAGGAVTTIGFSITGATGNDALVGGSTTVSFVDATADHDDCEKEEEVNAAAAAAAAAATVIGRRTLKASQDELVLGATIAYYQCW